MKNWVNTHNHTTFSMLDGHGSVENYAKRAKELQMGWLAITDHGNIHGWLDFYDECKEHGVKPILGTEAYQARKTRLDRDEEERAGRAKNEWDQRGPYHLGLIAQNRVGYQNLIKISSRAFTEGFYVKPRVDYDLIAEHSEGIIALSGCLGGAVQQALLRGDFEAALHHASTMQSVVGKDNYYIEIQDHGLKEQAAVKQDTLRIAKIIGAPVICTGDCHYVYKKDAHNHDVMLCAGTKAQLSEEERFKFPGEEFYLKSYEEMLADFEPEWLDNTCALAESVDLDLEFGEFHFPTFPDVPKEQTPAELLEEQVWAGITDRYGENPSEDVIERTKYELGVVKRMGFVEYFLVVGDLVRWAKSQGIRVGPGRGSAAGSILSYALHITGLDPIRFGLIFERFLVEGRKSMPDIDLDFDDRHRGRVIEYARQKYGEDRVVHIATFSTLGAKQAIRDACRVLGYDYAIGDKLSKLVPPMVLGVAKSLDDAMKNAEFRREYDTNSDSRAVVDAALGIEGIHRQHGVHAAGVVITPGPATDYVPVMQRGEGTPLVTQWDMHRIDQNGLLKIDFLGLRNLGVIDMALENIKKTTGKEIDIEAVTLEDDEVFSQLSQGNTNGVFQIESRGMREMTLAIQPDRLDDIMATISLYRPGPLGSGMDRMYINRKHGREKIAFPHPSLAEVLETSYGIMLYQEDVLNVAKVAAGYSAAEADDLRKVMGKKLMDKVAQYRAHFVEGCVKNSGMTETLANKLFSDIEFFAGYGFNRAHAASYAVIAYWTAWLKVHYPDEYMAALMTSCSEKRSRLPSYLHECKRMGIEVAAPSILESESEFKVSNPGRIVFGLSAIDGIGEAVIDKVMKDRALGRVPATLHEFMRYCDSQLLNKGTMEKLIYSGALDDLAGHEATLYQKEKFDLLTEEKSSLGLYVTEHPLETLWTHMQGDVTHSLADMEGVASRARVRVGGIVSDLSIKTTKAGRRMATFLLEDNSGTMECLIFPGDFANIDEILLKEGAIGVFEGDIIQDGEDDSAQYRLACKTFSPMDNAHLFGGLPITLTSKSKLTPKQIDRLYDIIRRNPGESPVFLQMPDNEGRLFTFKFTKLVDTELKASLEQIVKVSEVDI